MIQDKLSCSFHLQAALHDRVQRARERGKLGSDSLGTISRRLLWEHLDAIDPDTDGERLAASPPLTRAELADCLKVALEHDSHDSRVLLGRLLTELERRTT